MKLKKKFDLLDVQKVYEEIPRKRRLVALIECPPKCPLRGKSCTIDACPELEKRYGSLVRETLAEIMKTEPKVAKKPKRVTSREKSLLYRGTHIGGTFGEYDFPIFDTMVADKTVWCLPFEDADGKSWVSHRVTIYGVRNGRRYRLTIVEVYVASWTSSHDDCGNHKRKKLKRKRWVCDICGKRPDIKLRRKKSRYCSRCECIITKKTDCWGWNWVCTACNAKDLAKVRAWNWFKGEKLPESGIFYTYLPYERYEYKVVELKRSNSKSLGRVWN